MRVTPITAREELAPEHHAAFDEVVATYGGNVVGPLRVLFYSPELARSISGIGAPMRLASPFPSVRELGIISAAREWDCLYEWFVHEPVARRVGVSEGAIDAVRSNGPLRRLPREEAAVVRYVRNLLRRHRVPDDVFRNMIGRLGVRGVVELTATIGFYQIFACVMNAFEVPGDRPVDLPVRPRRSRLSGKTAGLSLHCGVEPRIPLITSREELSEEHQPLFDEVAARGRSETGALQVLLHVPELARRTAMAEEHICNKLTLPEDIQQLAILATARVSRCSCLWEGHEALALQAGVLPQVIAAARGDAGAGTPPAAAQVIDFTRKLLETNRVPEGEFKAMLDHLGLKGLVELAALIGFSSFMACILNAFEVQCRASAAAPRTRAAAGSA